MPLLLQILGTPEETKQITSLCWYSSCSPGSGAQQSQIRDTSGGGNQQKAKQRSRMGCRFEEWQQTCGKWRSQPRGYPGKDSLGRGKNPESESVPEEKRIWGAARAQVGALETTTKTGQGGFLTEDCSGTD